MTHDIGVKIFADGANKSEMLQMNSDPLISGLTTNPTLMKKAGIENYEEFCRDILNWIKEKPISFEVFSDDFSEMERQARKIASWGDNVYVKIPITNTKGIPSCEVVRRLSSDGIKLNVTALLTLKQVQLTCDALSANTPSFVSVFAGRVADTGVDPLPLMRDAAEIVNSVGKSELIWASPRELLNVIHAAQVGCHIITITSDIIKKFHLLGKNLDDYSLDTVKMFRDDAVGAGYKL